MSDGRAQRMQAPTTAALFITSPGFEEDGGSISSLKQLSPERPATYSLMNKSVNVRQSDGKGTSAKPALWAPTSLAGLYQDVFERDISVGCSSDHNGGSKQLAHELGD